MAAEVDVLARALADLNVVARSVLAVLPTGYSKSLMFQMFVRAKDCVKWG